MADLNDLVELCKTSAACTLNMLLSLGPRPTDPAPALLWEQQSTRLQGQLNSLTALVSKLSAAAVIDALGNFSPQLQTISKVSQDAQKKIKQIQDVSKLLTALSKVLDLGLSILAASAAPGVATIGAVVDAGTALQSAVSKGAGTA